jgi:hypothetical protein
MIIERFFLPVDHTQEKDDQQIHLSIKDNDKSSKDVNLIITGLIVPPKK